VEVACEDAGLEHDDSKALDDDYHTDADIYLQVFKSV